MMWHVLPLLLAWWLLLVLFAWALCRSASKADRAIEGWRNDRA